MLSISGNNLPFEYLTFHVFFRDTLYWALLPKNNLKLFILLNYSSSFWYSNTIQIVFPEWVITWYSVRTDLTFEYIFGTRFVRKFDIHSNSDMNHSHYLIVSLLSTKCLSFLCFVTNHFCFISEYHIISRKVIIPKLFLPLNQCHQQSIMIGVVGWVKLEYWISPITS